MAAHLYRFNCKSRRNVLYCRDWFRIRTGGPMTFKNVITVALALTLAAGLAACSMRTANRGNLPTESQLAKIEVGKHTKRYVKKLIGSPSTLATFDSQIWYYIGRRTEQWAFFEEEIIDQQIIAIYFDQKNVIEHIERYDKDDIRLIEMNGRVTPTAGHELGVIEQIIGNFGRFNRNRPQN